MKIESQLSGRMIFAFGLQRSGTYWLQRILTSHPAVAAVPSETNLFERVVAPLLEQFHQGARESPSVERIYAERESLTHGVRQLCDGVLEAHLVDGAEWLSERSPRHVMCVDLIAAIYPDAHCVHIIRDPRDVARSVVAHDWGPRSYTEAARAWKDGIERARAASAPLYRELRYEDVFADTPGAILRLYEWLGLPLSEEIVNTACADANTHVNADPAGTGVGLAKWQQHLSPAQVAEVEEVAGELMGELGYELSSDAGPASVTRPPTPARNRPPRKSVLARLRRRGHARAPADHNAVTASATFDRLLTSLHSADTDQLDELLYPAATVKLVTGDGLGVVRAGPAGRALLTEAILQDDALSGTQTTGSLHAIFPSVVGVLGYRLADGSTARRIVVATMRGDRVSHITLQRL